MTHLISDLLVQFLLVAPKLSAYMDLEIRGDGKPNPFFTMGSGPHPAQAAQVTQLF